MSISIRFEQALTQLRTAYEPLDERATSTARDDENRWPRFLRALLGIPYSHAASETLEELFVSTSLATPAAASEATAGQLVEILKPIPRGSQKASVVRAVAAWWLVHFGNVNSPEWSASLSSYRESLRPVRGLGPATVDELLLFAADLPVFPINRTALRVAIRHGWLDWPLEDEEAQSFFAGGLDRSVPLMQEFSWLLTKVGEEFCGKEPNCEGCPLQQMLPIGGPRES